MTTEQRLAEREKELACIYSICLLAAEAPAPEVAAEGIARSLLSAMQYREFATCSVDFARPAGGGVRCSRGLEHDSSAIPAEVIESPLPEDAAGGWSGSVRLEYWKEGLFFLPQEKSLLDSVIVVAASMLRTATLISDLRSASKDLTSKNAALREILSMIEDEKRRTLASMRERLSGELLPLAERVRDQTLPPEKRASWADLLANELGRDIASLGPAPATDPSLSPREREVAVQVRNGRTSKEIAELLGISPATVERHRHNIRRKLRVRDRGINLSGLLTNRESSEPT